MYADDLLILSETENGLTESLEDSVTMLKNGSLNLVQRKLKLLSLIRQGRLLM